MFDQYRAKIKTVEEIRDIVGDRPRDRVVVMCHGVFDILHPGHLRHLSFAAEQGDVLVASLTCDKFIAKGENRPYVPQDLRAANLAALEIVDYVIIDPNAEPIANIATLRPDYFVKGFEYTKDGLHPKTRAEIEVLDSYGGQFVFSPGDIVYSSTELLALHRPDLKVEKLITLMEVEGVTFDRLREIVEAMAGVRVHVVGDTIVDKYSFCTLLGPSTKTPTFSVKLEESKLFLGGAGIVAKHIRSLGADVTFTTVLGEDPLAAFVADDMSQWGIRVNAVTDPHRPTTQKERFWASSYKLLQVDTVENAPLAQSQIETVCGHVRGRACDVVVFSDFRHGLFHQQSISPLTTAIPAGAIRVADSQVASRWGNVLEFRGFDLITPNLHEARFALGDQDSQVTHLGRRVRQESEARNVILKLGERGLIAYGDPETRARDALYLDSFVHEEVDEVGAGDALLAASSLAFAARAELPEAAIIGSAAAALACEVEGNVPITRERLLGKIDRLRELTEMQAE